MRACLRLVEFLYKTDEFLYEASACGAWLSSYIKLMNFSTKLLCVVP